MTTRLLPLTGDGYQTHPLHSTERIWTETNCYVDVWLELLHSLGLDPMVAGAFAISTDFEGDQWTFFKYPEADLRRAYGIDVHEMNPWRGVLEHVVEQLELGRLMTVEADSFYLPDTHGVSYQIEHVKSTIVPNAVDVQGRFLGYFHNAGYFELTGDDFDGIFRRGAHAEPALPPYTEIIRLDSVHHLTDDDAVDMAHTLLAEHVAKRPGDNPITRMAERTVRDLRWLRDQPPEKFHLWAFGTVRQCGACAETAASFLSWLTDHGGAAEAKEASRHWTNLAEQAKALQFALARAARGRQIDLSPIMQQMAEEWDSAQSLTSALAGP
ncbi:DUF1839 family protein [Flexivirga oryzae]|uniref:DUF1839 family protein n=1 Tax=Flexivirga oryzae TaxID=1794944 RepID=A0A839MZZ1_9MICO|nr:DUF1839 family protein [Flexivirga oryzae]MBB2890159.1 hypothetical protein [Flexivirga oryzae]